MNNVINVGVAPSTRVLVALKAGKTFVWRKQNDPRYLMGGIKNPGSSKSNRKQQSQRGQQ